MLINNKVKLINTARKFTKVSFAISFFRKRCYERCVRSCYILGKKKMNLLAFVTILFRV